MLQVYRMEGIYQGIPKKSQKPIVDGIVTGIPKDQHPNLEPKLTPCTPGATRKGADTFGAGLTPQGVGNLKGKKK